jgi:hypothetical protein
MSGNPEHKEMKPYTDEELVGVLESIARDEVFPELMDFVYPEKSIEELKEILKTFSTIRDFQHKFMAEVFGKIISKTSDGAVLKGLHNIKADKPVLLLANHRDIILDSAILQVLLVKHGYDTTEIAIGNNLMIYDFVIDIGRINKMIIVKRDGSGRELLEFSKELSSYIRNSITSGSNSVWIAQRNGRTKNGDDRTDPGLLKMLYLSGPKDLYQNFQELNIIPVAISYEIEPCASLKTRELFMRSQGPYVKKPGEDLESILTGIMKPKGRIELNIGKPLMEEYTLDQKLPLNDRIAAMSRLADKEIHRIYKLWPSNFIAFDMIYGKHSDKYSKEEFRFFQDYMNESLKDLKGDGKALRRIFLEIYANPVINAIEAKK